LIERYSPPAIRAVWADQHRFELFLRIEILACEAWAGLGRIPESALPKIRKATFDAARIAEVEARVGHDVIAFLTVINESIGQPEARYVHLGMTSQDLNDTAMAVQLVESSRIIARDLGSVREAAAELAVRHRKTLMAGRTHGIVAEPTTFGFKVAGWVAELDRALARLVRATDEIAVGRVSGAVGTHATVDPRVEEHVCAALDLKADPISTQVVARDRHASFMSALALAAAAMERIAIEIRHLQRSEVGEAFEPFGKEQKGSSAMPHKRNPVISENLTGLARLVRSMAQPALEDVALWHERDISHSSVERVIGPDATIALDFALHRLATTDQCHRKDNTGMKIDGSIALVTGGASGLGLATAELLASRGAKVVVVDLPRSAGEEVAGRLGGRFAAADVTRFAGELARDNRLLLHLAEGVDDTARRHFQALQLPDGTWAISNHLVGIHSVGLHPDERRGG